MILTDAGGEQKEKQEIRGSQESFLSVALTLETSRWVARQLTHLKAVNKLTIYSRHEEAH